ncbi:hypothetical protein [Alienimonas chondri]|uniref:Uncharacterized protein n=1 Tax=Alienimonas chondri TaxID=2681879 RepID=A0ABX1VF33_9PLAN|nr:hypothetical protein [Alienimonas chondri]NNJ26695.1 hypothetical protein [Alienimonas chondri]
MPPATMNATAEHERTAGPPQAIAASGDASALFLTPANFEGAFADPAAVEAARDAVARYLGELGLPVNSRATRTATAACLDAAFGDVGPQATPAQLSRIALRHAALGMSRWLAELPGRVPTPPRHAALAARLSVGGTRAVPVVRHRTMTPQRFGK